MRIGIPLSESNLLAEHFSKATQFAIFDVHDDTRAVSYVGRQVNAEPGCGRNATFLRGQGVEVVLGHHVSENATKHLLEVGIVAIQDAPLLSADALIAHLVSGTLQGKAPEIAGQSGGCGGGCGHCGGGDAAHEVEHHHHEHAEAEGCGGHATSGCGSHGCGGQGACGSHEATVKASSN